MKACRLFDIFHQFVLGLSLREDADAYSTGTPELAIKIYFKFHQHQITVSLLKTLLLLLDISRFPKENLRALAVSLSTGQRVMYSEANMHPLKTAQS